MSTWECQLSSPSGLSDASRPGHGNGCSRILLTWLSVESEYFAEWYANRGQSKNSSHHNDQVLDLISYHPQQTTMSASDLQPSKLGTKEQFVISNFDHQNFLDIRNRLT